MDNPSMTKIKYLMAVRRWTYEDLAKALTVVKGKEVTAAHAGKLVRSNNKTSRTAGDLAAAFGVPLEEIYKPLY